MRSQGINIRGHRPNSSLLGKWHCPEYYCFPKLISVGYSINIANGKSRLIVQAYKSHKIYQNKPRLSFSDVNGISPSQESPFQSRIAANFAIS